LWQCRLAGKKGNAEHDQCRAGEIQGGDLLVEEKRRHEDDKGNAGSGKYGVRDREPEFAKRCRKQEDVCCAQRQAATKQASPRQRVRLARDEFEDDIGADIECDGQGQERIPHALGLYALDIA